jgi:hypothetical protein
MNAVQAKIDAARKLAADTREKAAAELLAVTIVLEMITKASAEGVTTIVIRPQKPHDLSGTAAAAELVKQLHAGGAGCEWQKRQWGSDGPFVPELTIRW